MQKYRKLQEAASGHLYFFWKKTRRASAKERDMEDGEELVKVWSGLEMQWEGTGQSQVTKWVENLGNLRASVFVNTIRLDYL